MNNNRKQLICNIFYQFVSLGIIFSALKTLKKLDILDTWDYIFNITLILLVIDYGLKLLTSSLKEIRELNKKGF